MFEHPAVHGADEYQIEVDINGPSKSFYRPLITHIDSATAAIIENLEFGNQYIWRYAGLKNGKNLGWIGPYTFETLSDSFVDKKSFRVRILKNDSAQNAGGLIILDVPSIIIDRSGKPVWFMRKDNEDSSAGIEPLGAESNGSASAITPVTIFRDQNRQINDLQITPSGTFTFLAGLCALEADLKGRFLWMAPAANKYSHCFRKLTNGNYMVIDHAPYTPKINSVASVTQSDAPVIRTQSLTQGNGLTADDGTKDFDSVISATQFDAPVNSSPPLTRHNGLANEIIKEFDPAGNLVWQWNSESYFDSSDVRMLLNTQPDTGLINKLQGGHMNAFNVDEENGFVYAGFRNLSRVVKIDKLTGKVICAWGKNATYRGSANADGFFSKQHEITLLHDGTLAVFSNFGIPKMIDTPSAGQSSAVVVFSQPDGSTNSRLVWQFDCSLLDSSHFFSFRGGSVDELRSGNLLVGTGTNGRAFEITRNNHIVWYSVIEKYNQNDSSWQPFPLYKSHYTSSLYPCYFTVQISLDTLTEKVENFQLHIFNDGTENDSYQISISSATGSYKKQFTSNVLVHGKSVSFQIARDKLPADGESIKVLVKSKTNPDLVRKFSIPVKIQASAHKKSG